jgi:rhodanese-related sulfurtransferase
MSLATAFLKPIGQRLSLIVEIGGGRLMSLAVGIVGVLAAVSVLIALRQKRSREQREMDQRSITPGDLHALLASNQELLLFDVRQPLDLLAYPEIIPRAKRIAPNDVLENPALIPQEKDTVVYCTCPSDKTSRIVLRRALALHFNRIKLLKGGFAAWKANNYPVEPYNEVFHLYTPSVARAPGK